MKKIHVSLGDTFALAIGWLNKHLYGEGGLYIQLGFYYINFWEREY